MRWWEKSLRIIGKVLLIALVGTFILILFFPGVFTKYLQSYANRNYLIPMGLRFSYTDVVGDPFGNIHFQYIRIAARDGEFTVSAEDTHMKINFLRLLRRDLSFDEISIGRLHLELLPTDSARQVNRLELERLPWISVQHLNIEDGRITQGDTDVWFQVAGNLDLTDAITLDDARITLAHPQLPDTLRLIADCLDFDGQRLIVLDGDLSYQTNHVALSGSIQTIPRLDMNLQVELDKFQRPAALPDWLDCYSIAGRLQGNPESLECQLSLGLSAQGHRLDQANMHFSLTDEGIRIHRGLFARGSQCIETRGNVNPEGSLALEATFLQTRLADFLPGVPELSLEGTAGIQAYWHAGELDSLKLALALDQLEYQGNTLRDIKGGLEMANQVWTITDTTSLHYASGDIQLWGLMDAGQGALDMEVYLQTNSLDSLLDSLGWIPVEGRANGQVWISGSWANPSLTGAVMLYDTRYLDMNIGLAFIQFLLDSTLTYPHGRLYASTGDLDLMGFLAEGGEAEFIFEGDTVIASTLRLYRGLEKLDTRGYLTFADSIQVVLDTVTAWRNTEILASDGIRARRVGKKVGISPTTVSIAGGQMTLSGDWISPHDFNLETGIERVDLERLFRFLGRPPRLHGIVNASAHIGTRDGSLAIIGSIDATNGEFDQIPFTQLHSRFFLEDNRLNIEELNWRDQGGVVIATGQLAYVRDESHFGGLGTLDSLNLTGKLDNYQFHHLQPILPWSIETNGLVTGSFTAMGQAKAPVYTADLIVTEPRFDRLTGEVLSGRLRYEGQQLEFIDLALRTAAGLYTGGGTIPADLRPTTGVLDVIKDAPVDLSFTGNTSQLDFITPYFGDIDSLNGEYEVEIALSGTIEQLIRNGRLTVNNGKVELFVMENPIVEVEGEVVLKDNLLRIERLEGRTPSSRRVKDDSRLAVTGTMDMTRFFKPAFDLQLTGEHVYFSLPLREIELIGSPSFTVTGRDTVNFRGDFVPDPEQAYFRMAFAGPESYVLKKLDEGTILVYNIHIPLYSGATVDNSEVNAEIDGEITLTKVGSEDFRYAGNINVVSGSFVFNGHDFVFDEGWVTLDPSAFNPRYYLRATTQVEILESDPENPQAPPELELVDVTLVLTGTLEDPQMLFESSAMYSESDLLQFFALGKGPEEGIDPARTAGLNLTNILLRRIEADARLASGLDRFRIQTTS
ncbi:MAG: translocation/assembly module TamB domain-containing protein, partial [Candidatus Neomarinimicrobiota bacterium]